MTENEEKMQNELKKRLTKALQLKIITLLILIHTLLFTASLVSSASPFQQTGGNLIIETPSFDALTIGKDHRFHAHVINSTATKTNKTTSCVLHFYNTSGYDTNIGTTAMEFEDYNGIDFALTLGSGNFSKAGQYSYVIHCNSSNEVGFISGQMDATPSGEVADTARSVIDIGLLSVLIWFLLTCVFIFMKTKTLLTRVTTIGLGYIFFTAITFISWNMANDFLISAPFIAEAFRILFFTLMIGFFPLVIGGFAWYFYMLTQLKEIKRLMGKGFSEDEAYRRRK